MRAASRLFAAVKPEKYLEAGAPTGLTGLLTHPSPRSTLLYLYNSTLDKLAAIPESSVYRQSTEALTKHRLAIIEAAKPAGLKEWQERIQMQVNENPNAFEIIETSRGSRIRLSTTKKIVDFRLRASEWDGETLDVPNPQGLRSYREKAAQMGRIGGGLKYDPERDVHEVSVEREPRLTAEQISEVESQMGAGLIEEVIQVAEGEHKLVDEMVKAAIWEELCEQPPQDQWKYFERPNHLGTQKPPNP